MRRVGLVLVAVLLAACSTPDRAPTPAPAPATTTAPPAGIPVTRPDYEALAVDTVRAPEPDAPLVTEDPPGTAALVTGDPDDESAAYVLGPDGRWRRVEVPGQESLTDGYYTSPIVSSTVLDERSTHLAIPQRGRLVVVDLGTGRHRTYPVGDETNHYVLWLDDAHVQVIGENRRRGGVVDLRTGAVTASTYGPATRTLPDGTALTWGEGRGNDKYRDGLIHWDDSRQVLSTANNAAGFFPVVPLVRDGVAVGLHHLGRAMVSPWVSSGDDALDELMETHNGVAAVDADTGEVLGFLALSGGLGETSSLLGWAGDRPVLALVPVDFDKTPPAHPPPAYVVVWDYRAATLDPVATLPSSSVAWGDGSL